MKHYLDFEKPIVELQRKLDDLRQHPEQHSIGISWEEELQQLQLKLEEARRQIFTDLTPWQRVQLARHPKRPYTLDYLRSAFTEFEELHGDRMFSDDRAFVGGFAKLGDQRVVVLGTQKGRETKESGSWRWRRIHGRGGAALLQTAHVVRRMIEHGRHRVDDGVRIARHGERAHFFQLRRQPRIVAGELFHRVDAAHQARRQLARRLRLQDVLRDARRLLLKAGVAQERVIGTCVEMVVEHARAVGIERAEPVGVGARDHALAWGAAAVVIVTALARGGIGASKGVGVGHVGVLGLRAAVRGGLRQAVARRRRSVALNFSNRKSYEEE